MWAHIHDAENAGCRANPPASDRFQIWCVCILFTLSWADATHDYLTKPQKHYTKPLSIRQNLKLLNEYLKYLTRVATNIDLT